MWDDCFERSNFVSLKEKSMIFCSFKSYFQYKTYMYKEHEKSYKKCETW